jgi:hypothetical protein
MSVAIDRSCRCLHRPPSHSSHFSILHTRPPCGAGMTLRAIIHFHLQQIGEHTDRGAVLKRYWVRNCFTETLRTGLFRRRPIMSSTAARPCRSSGCDLPPACFWSCLTPGGCSMSTRLVDVQLAAFLDAASRLSAVNSNIRLPPQIYPHPPRRRTAHGILYRGRSSCAIRVT